MSIVSSLNHSKFFSFSQPKLHLGNGTNSSSHFNSIRFSSKSVIPLPKFSANLKSITRLRAYDSDDYSEIPPEDEEIISKAITTLLTEEIKEEEEEEEVKEITNLKKSLIDLLYGTERGLKASSDTRAEIIELISELESNNPIPAPNDGLTTLGGKWILAYTSFTGLFPLLAKGTTPLVSVGEISQIIDTENFTVQNSVQFVGPLATTTSLSTNAKYEVRSPKRVQIKFEEGIIGTPQLTDFIVIPESVEFLGHKIDLTPFNGLFTSVHDTASYVIKTISSQPPLKIPITKANAESWLLTTYLDKELRISREDGGSIFVFIKEGSSLLKP